MNNPNKIQNKLMRFKEVLKEYGDITAEDYDHLRIIEKPSRDTLRNYTGIKDWSKLKDTILSTEDFEIITENVKLAKKMQRFQDSNRIERKAFREWARIENAIEEYSNEMKKILEKHNLATYIKNHKYTQSQIESETIGVMQLADTHFNELVELSHNKYDFTIASKRCALYVYRAKEYFKLYNVKHVLLAINGDILNSDRRIDELLNETTNRAKATFLAIQIIEQMILDLNQDFNVSVACVTGNESRIQEDIAWTDILITDNYDFVIFNFLNELFKRNNGGVTFIHGNYAEQVVNIKNKHILLIHGEQISDKIEESVQKIRGKYASRGIIIDFILLGHLHSCRIGDMYSRSSSMVGANAYSDSALQLASRASQNIHILYDNGMYDSIKIDLQIPESDINTTYGYDINKELESYNVKSVTKTRHNTEILKIVI